MRSANMTLQEIADQLNAESIPTLRGGREWRPSTIQTALGTGVRARATAGRRCTTEGVTGVTARPGVRLHRGHA